MLSNFSQNEEHKQQENDLLDEIEYAEQEEYMATSSAEGYRMPYRAAITSKIIPALTHIAKFSNIRSHEKYRHFLSDIMHAIKNYSDPKRVWNVADIMLRSAAGNLKAIPAAPAAGADPSAEFIEFSDADAIFLSILMALLTGDALGCIDDSPAAIARPDAGRTAFERLEKLVRTKCLGYNQTIKKNIRNWGSTFTLRQHPHTHLKVYREAMRELGKKDDDTTWMEDMLFDLQDTGPCRFKGVSARVRYTIRNGCRRVNVRYY